MTEKIRLETDTPTYEELLKSDLFFASLSRGKQVILTQLPSYQDLFIAYRILLEQEHALHRQSIQKRDKVTDEMRIAYCEKAEEIERELDKLRAQIIEAIGPSPLDN